MKVLGTPKPSLQWFKDDLEVFSSDRLEIREEEDGGTVIVREARLGINSVDSNICPFWESCFKTYVNSETIALQSNWEMFSG